MLKRRVYLFPSDPTTAPAVSRQLEREGWVLLRGAFGPDEVDQLRCEIGGIFEAEPPGARQSHQVPALAEQFRCEMFNRSEACQRAMSNRAILDVVEPLLGEDCHVIANTAWRNPANVEHLHGGGRDAGRFFLQIHYGRRDLAQRLRPTSDSNQLSTAAIERARSERDRTLIGLHPPLFYDG